MSAPDAPALSCPGPIPQSPSTESSAAPSSLFSSRSSTTQTEDFATIPPSHPARTLVLCFDGFGNQFDAGIHNSNVLKFHSLLKKGDGSQQMVYYESGGRGYHGSLPFVGKVDALLDTTFAWNLGTRVQRGYEFLMEHYIEGDKVSLFGFSSGAHVAGALIGMLDKVGLMTTHNPSMIPLAYSLYVRNDEVGWKQSADFKETFSIDVPIDFVGVWDAVASVGVIPRVLPLMGPNTSIRVLRHAVALDERRLRFTPILFHQVIVEAPQSEFEHSDNRGPTDVKDVWFVGGHGDVGGGAVADGTPHSLGRISLRWIVRECFRANTGIQFNAERLKTIGLNPASLYPVVEPPQLSQVEPHHFNTVAAPIPQASEEDHELRDAVAPMYEGRPGLIDLGLDLVHCAFSLC